jgi:copper chaperone CopZ
METKTFKVPNIGCDGCVNTVKAELNNLSGVSRVEASLETKLVTVDFAPPTTWQDIEKALVAIDYAPEGERA